MDDQASTAQETERPFVRQLLKALSGTAAASTAIATLLPGTANDHKPVPSATPRPFRYRATDAELRDLRRRLTATRWAGAVDRESWGDGTNPEFLQRLVAFWRTEFDWRAQERAINALPQFRVELGGVGVHFVHVRGVGPDPLPLLMTNGWPSSFLEYRKIIPLLTDPAAHGGDPRDAFHVVIPSLPGFGFSDAPAAPGMHVGRIAAMWHALMVDVLGFDRFGAHGSDIGVGVSSMLGLMHPPQLLGVHLTSVTGSAIVRDLGSAAPPLTGAEQRSVAESAAWAEREGAYAHLHRTKPQTLAYALTDSPVGLAAWTAEKFRSWSDCGGDVERRFSFDDLLTTITLYWLTKSIGPSMRLYREGHLHRRELKSGERVEVPCGVALFPKDLSRPPREWGLRAYRITRWTEMRRGGHFPAHEEPRLLAEDLRAFFRELRGGR